MIEIFKALLTPTIAVLGIYIAIQQYRLAKEKHRIEIYDRRMKIYTTVMEFVRNAKRNFTINEDNYYEFDKGIAEAEFLFGKEVVALLEDMSNVAFDILMTRNKNDFQEAPTKLTTANLRHAEIIESFLEFEFRVKDLFSPYLRLPGVNGNRKLTHLTG
ncbi:hypothetical protein [Geobacter benzoatilyticus]|uniref:DUF4760 domain-containing protein n=1 Tax=Geobacter benzoatilyticus TaxID=2815309 RepID=A0ABX7Q5K5_9BACT|nr:hypothetical protein [Geobacter benzoatilyticus]QSV46275.1 hypothetical protein JZM60_03070 [Geobacter benzoatilyticus]